MSGSKSAVGGQLASGDDASSSSTGSIAGSAPSELLSSDSDIIDVSYPVFASVWDSNSSLVIGGGGGEGRNGVKNKITVIKVRPENKGLAVRNEIVLAGDEDNPTSLDVGGHGRIYAGVNRSTKAIQEGRNTHLRVFDYKNTSIRDGSGVTGGTSEELAAVKVFSANDSNEYQKCTRVSNSGELLALSSSSSPGSLYVIETKVLLDRSGSDVTETSDTLYTKTAGSGPINDIDFSPGSDKLAYISDSKLYVINAQTGEENIVVDMPRKDAKFAKLRYISENTVIIAANLNQRKGVVLYKFNPNTGGRIASRALSSKIRAISTMDAGSKYTVVGTSDCSIAIVSSTSLNSLKKLDRVHEIAITSVALNRSQTRIASTSVSGTVRVLELPLDGIFNGGIKSIIYALWSVILIALLAVVLQVLMKRQFFDALISSEDTGAVTITSDTLSGEVIDATSTPFVTSEEPVSTVESIEAEIPTPETEEPEYQFVDENEPPVLTPKEDTETTSFDIEEPELPADATNNQDEQPPVLTPEQGTETAISNTDEPEVSADATDIQENEPNETDTPHLETDPDTVVVDAEASIPETDVETPETPFAPVPESTPEAVSDYETHETHETPADPEPVAEPLSEHGDDL
ncbi:Sar family guanine nucleotide exchange factor SEC12 [Sugiyamaella lignohabitans]|uniref:Guanine nucleotide-exchange factor SEC12 n=1 Tax=Sugiyamaella lignohabitans TaxID=796027 RepID=A0A167F9I3_9ASCO|nr:Sar family guanine nucleotide exchange factor SEC12 [Sugiyamaella lignohabitans]ANB14994.1 Sar family guanine nucleotide exchange factor SEC12 [Sugiyamaella lignohabitans]